MNDIDKEIQETLKRINKKLDAIIQKSNQGRSQCA